MKLIIQKVTRAAVRVDDEIVGQIGRGLCVLAGIHRTDTEKEIKWCAKKLLGIRLFEEGDKHWKKNVKDEDLELLVVSQFTLYSGNATSLFILMKNKQVFSIEG